MPTPITIEGKVYHIVAAEPHWETAVRLRLSLGSVIAEGHTGEAAVAPLWESARSWLAGLTGGTKAVSTLRAALLAELDR